MTAPDTYPMIRDLGLTAMLVTFSECLSEPANRAALAFRAAVEAAKWEGVEETATSLASAVIRFDPLVLAHADLETRLTDLLATQDWYSSKLPRGRTLWRIPVVLGGTHGPQFEEAAALAGRDPDQAKADILASQTRVLAIGFAPGQPYLGELPEAWNMPRRSELNPEVPGGALVTAIRQLIIYAKPAPTGWRHIGQTAFQCFRAGSETPFALSPGDEVTFTEITSGDLEDIRADDQTGDGGATREVLG